MNHVQVSEAGRAVLSVSGVGNLPALFTPTPAAHKRTLEFFTANIRNKNTRRAYAHAIGEFAAWCEARGLVDLGAIEPVQVAAYVEQLQARLGPPSVKLQLAALRVLFDWLVVGQILPFNPASSVRGPRHSVRKGKTPVLAAEEARALLDAIDVSTSIGLRDRALIGLMVYTFARAGAPGCDCRKRVENSMRCPVITTWTTTSTPTWMRCNPPTGRHSCSAQLWVEPARWPVHPWASQMSPG